MEPYTRNPVELLKEPLKVPGKESAKLVFLLYVVTWGIIRDWWELGSCSATACLRSGTCRAVGRPVNQGFFSGILLRVPVKRSIKGAPEYSGTSDSSCATK